MRQIIWQKKNGDIVKRIITTCIDYRVGQVNSYKWKIIDIKYKHGKKWLSRYEYDKISDKKYKIDKKVFQLKKSLKLVYNNLLYCIILLILFRTLETTITFVI